jgi:chromosome segregation ATPase
MKICPICEHENPSNVNFCGKCGASLADGKLPDDVILRKELEDAKQHIEHYKTELDKANAKIVELEKQNSGKAYQAEIEKFKDDIVNIDAEKTALEKQLKMVRNGIAGHRTAWIIFLIVSVILGGILIANIKNLEFNENEKDNLNSKVHSLENENQSLQAQISDLTEVQSDYQTSIAMLTHEKDSIMLKCDTLTRVANNYRYRVNVAQTYFNNKSEYLVRGDVIYILKTATDNFDNLWGWVEYTWNDRTTQGWLKMDDLKKANTYE